MTRFLVLAGLMFCAPAFRAAGQPRDIPKHAEELFASEKYEEAITAYTLIAARNPKNARAQFQIGECLFAGKKHDEAARELLKVDILYAYPEWSAAALYEAGRCFEALGQTVEARQQFTAVVERFEKSRWARLAQERLAVTTAGSLPGHGAEEHAE